MGGSIKVVVRFDDDAVQGDSCGANVLAFWHGTSPEACPVIIERPSNA